MLREITVKYRNVFLGIKIKERGDENLALKGCIISYSLAFPPPITLRRSCFITKYVLRTYLKTKIRYIILLLIKQWLLRNSLWTFLYLTRQKSLNISSCNADDIFISVWFSKAKRFMRKYLPILIHYILFQLVFLFRLAIPY